MRHICHLIQIREEEQFGDVLWYSHLIVKTRLLLIKSFVLRHMS